MGAATGRFETARPSGPAGLGARTYPHGTDRADPANGRCSMSKKRRESKPNLRRFKPVSPERLQAIVTASSSQPRYVFQMDYEGADFPKEASLLAFLDWLDEQQSALARLANRPIDPHVTVRERLQIRFAHDPEAHRIVRNAQRLFRFWGKKLNRIGGPSAPDVATVKVRPDIAANYLIELTNWVKSLPARENVATVTGADRMAMLTVARLAEISGVPQEALRLRIVRWRRKHLEGWIEDHEAKSRQPRFLYRYSAVEHIIANLKAKQTASSRQPANNRRKKS